MTLGKATTKTSQHRFDAFISYSHKADSELARVLQVRLERWARPWFAARTAKLFRDQISLTATPHLWTTIAESLDNSGYLILLASTDSAMSDWVPRELCYWLTVGKCDDPDKLKPDQVVNDRVDRLMIVLTEGHIEWSHAAGDFDWSVTSALPRVLCKLPWQPLWTDLRWARGMIGKQIEADERFTEPVLKLLSPIRGKTPQELFDANDKEQRRAVALFRRLSIGLLTLFFAALAAAWFAYGQWNTADQRLAETRLQNARRSLLSDGNASAGGLWLAETLQTSGLRAAEARQAARFLLAGWKNSLPLHSLVHRRRVKATSWSPDRRKIATISGNQAFVWDVSTGELVGAPMQHENELSTIDYSPDGKHIAISSSNPFTHDGTLVLWDTTADNKCEILHGSEIFSVSFSFDGKAILASTNGSARLFNIEAGKKPNEIVLPHEYLVLLAKFSPDGKTIVTGNGGLKGESEGDLRVWDAGTGQLRFDPISYENGASVAFSPNGKTIAVLYDGKIEERDLATGKVIGNWRDHDRSASVLFTAGGHIREAISSEGASQMWEVDTQTAVTDHDFVNAETQLEATVTDYIVRLWRTAKVTAADYTLQNESAVTAASLSHDENTMLIGCENGTTWSWDLKTRQKSKLPITTEGSVKALSISRDSKILLAADSRDVRRWSWTSRTVEKLPAIGMEIERAVINPVSQIIATASFDVPQGGFEPPDGWINFTSTNAGFLLNGESINDMAFTSDGKVLASAWSDNAVRLIDTTTAKHIGESFHHLESVQAVAISPDGAMLACATTSDLQIWSLAEGRRVGESMPMHGAPSIVAFSPDGSCVVVVMDKRWQVWDLATRCPVCDVQSFKSTISTIEFVRGNQLIAISEAENVHFVKLPYPVDADAQDILLSLEVRTATTIDNGTVRPLSESEWLKKRSILQKIGGDCLGEKVERRIGSEARHKEVLEGQW